MWDLLLCLALGAVTQTAFERPAVAVGVWYAGASRPASGGADAELEAIRGDLASIRRAGFNAITAELGWRDAEPADGTYALADVSRLIAAAAEAGLATRVVLDPVPAPAWAANRPDAWRRFTEYAARRLSLLPGVLAVDPRAATSTSASTPARIPVAPGAAVEARLALWEAVARGVRHIAFAPARGTLVSALALGETAGVLTRNEALFGSLRPRAGGVTAIEGDGAPGVAVHLLESSQALMIIGLNRGPQPRAVRIRFAAGIPEAIWQNLETGTAMAFVMGSAGPTLEYTFGPRDALVLVIRKTLR